MGSTNVSSVGNLLLAKQAGNLQTGASDDDLKIQFAQMMSEMTSQVGGNAMSQDNGSSQGQTNDIGKVAAAEGYDKYQYRESSIKKSSSAQKADQSQTKETIESYAEDVKEVLKEELGVTDEQIEAAMEALGQNLMDLVNPTQLAALVAQLTGCSDPGELLCIESFQQILSEVGSLTEDLLDKLGMTRQELLETCEMLQNSQAETETVATIDTAANVGQTEETTTATETTDTMSNGTQTENTANKALTNQTEQTAVEETNQQTTAAEVSGETQKEPVTEEKAAVQEDVQSEDVTGETVEEPLKKEMASSGEQQTGNQTNPQGQQTNTAAMVQQDFAEVSVTGQGEVTPAYTSGQLDVENIIKQIAEFTKVTVADTETTMEMQLNPEHLGKIYIEITSREGVVSAHLMAQNEVVKEALENQMVELRQNMNQAGVKVDAVEVTVGSHEFERNLEQDAKQQEQQAEEQEKSAGRIRRINLGDLDELSGVMTEEETLVAQMMADNGNTIDFTA